MHTMSYAADHFLSCFTAYTTGIRKTRRKHAINTESKKCCTRFYAYSTFSFYLKYFTPLSKIF